MAVSGNGVWRGNGRSSSRGGRRRHHLQAVKTRVVRGPVENAPDPADGPIASESQLKGAWGNLGKSVRAAVAPVRGGWAVRLLISSAADTGSEHQLPGVFLTLGAAMAAAYSAAAASGADLQGMGWQ